MHNCIRSSCSIVRDIVGCSNSVFSISHNMSADLNEFRLWLLKWFQRQPWESRSFYSYSNSFIVLYSLSGICCCCLSCINCIPTFCSFRISYKNGKTGVKMKTKNRTWAWAFTKRQRTYIISFLFFDFKLYFHLNTYS